MQNENILCNLVTLLICLGTTMKKLQIGCTIWQEELTMKKFKNENCPNP